MNYQEHAELMGRLERLANKLDRLIDRLESATVPPLSFCRSGDLCDESQHGVLAEMLIPLSEVPKHLPKVHGVGTHIRTLFRWAHQGKRGCKLETVMVGSTRCTSMQALHRFFTAVTNSNAEGR